MLFNIYYINTFKMYEIKMMINNRMKTTEQEEKHKNKQDEMGAEVEGEATALRLFKLRAKAKTENITNDTRKFVENFDIKSTKSTMLKEVIEKCNSFENTEVGKLKEGMLVIADSLKVTLTNATEILGVKVLNNKTITMVYEGIDIGKVFDAAIKDYAYIFTAISETKERIIFKIPVTFENEFESMYSVNDILIGKVGIIGIYKGIVNKNEIKNMVDVASENKEIFSENIEIIDSDQIEGEVDSDLRDSYHYIDIISIIQKLHIEDKEEK